jgi:hypothetical protein
MNSRRLRSAPVRSSFGASKPDEAPGDETNGQVGELRFYACIIKGNYA